LEEKKMESIIILTVILLIAVLGKANSVAIAACGLIMIKLVKADKYLFPIIEKSGLFWGIVLLTAAILIPIARGDITYQNIAKSVISWTGIAALVISLVTTYLSGLGLRYLTLENHGDIMPALILGAVAAAGFLGGVPVGPLITSGILAVFVKIFTKK
jgi:uncharacterized membrane protein (DUF441 family)